MLNRHFTLTSYLATVLIAIALCTMLAFSKSVLAQTLNHQPMLAAQTSQASELTAPEASKSVSAASLFTKNCAGCHARGGNVVRRSKTLKQKALKRYGYDSVIKISQIITNGKGVMSGYSDRLTAKEIEAIAQYVKAQSETNWN